MISSDFMVCDFCHFSGFVSSCDLLNLRFLDYPIFPDSLERVISRFFDVVFSPEFEDSKSSPFSDFQFSGLSMCGFWLFDSLGFFNVGCRQKIEVPVVLSEVSKFPGSFGFGVRYFRNVSGGKYSRTSVEHKAGS